MNSAVKYPQLALPVNPLINEPDPSRLMYGLRDTGYDFYTAAADIIDNSIAAEAQNIQINIELTHDGRKFVYFGDDGHGMDEKALYNAMRYGAKIRADLASLGKFGLGLKTASSAVCLNYSLISRTGLNEPLNKLTWDLEHVMETNTWEMKADPVTDDEAELFEELCGDSGTLVVWARCDRLLSKVYANPGGAPEQSAIKTRRKKLMDHCALIFHKYLDPADSKYRNVNIFVNGEKVEYWNPFYPERSEQMLPEALTRLSIQREDGTIHEALIRAWVLPHSKDMTSEEEAKYAKISSRGQGFYIHREGRVIHYGDYLGLWRADDPHFSLFRVEFDFGHELDEAFMVDVKKSKILLDPALEEELQSLLGPARKEAERRYRRRQVAVLADGISHKDSNKAVKETKNADKVTSNDVDEATGTAVISNNRGQGISIKTPIESNLSADSLFIKPVDNLPNGALWEPFLSSESTSNYSTGVHLNKQHDFYTKVYSQSKSGVSIEGLDLLLWALAAAEHKNTDKELSAMWEDLREEVSSNLRKLLRSIELPSG